MRVEKKPKHLHIEFIVTSHNSGRLFLFLKVISYESFKFATLILGFISNLRNLRSSVPAPYWFVFKCFKTSQVHKNRNGPSVKFLIHCWRRRSSEICTYFHCQINVWSLSDSMTIDSLRCYAIHNFRCLEFSVLFIPSIHYTLFSGTTSGHVICWTLL